MEDINFKEFRNSYQSFPNLEENVLIKVKNTHPVESALNQVQILYSVFDLQKSKKTAEDSYRLNLFKSDFVSDGGLKEKFSKYYDSTTFNKSKTFRKSLSYTKFNDFNRSDGFNKNTATLYRTGSEYCAKFKPSSAKFLPSPLNLQNQHFQNDKEIKILSPKSHKPQIKEKSLTKNNSNKNICSLRLNDERENLLNKNSISNFEGENNQTSFNTKKVQISSKSLSVEPKSPLIINNYFINSVNSPNLGNTIKEEKRLLTIEEKIDMMTKLVKTKEDLIIKQVKNELIQKEKEKNEKIQKKLNYLNDRNMLDKLKDEVIAEKNPTSGDNNENKLVSLKSTNLDGKEMKKRVKSASSLDFKIDRKHNLKPRVDSIEFLRKILCENRRLKSNYFSNTYRKPLDNNYLSNSFRKSAPRDKYKAITVDSRGFKESNYNYTLRSRRTIKTEISDFIRKKNKEHKEKAIKLKDKENENLIKKYIELMKINKFLDKSKINTMRSVRTKKSSEKYRLNTEISKKKIKNEMFVGKKEKKRKNIDDSSILDYDQYYLNILESKLILNPTFNLRKVASGYFKAKNDPNSNYYNEKIVNIQPDQQKNSNIINFFPKEEKSNNNKQEGKEIKNKPQSNQEFLEFLNRKESEIKNSKSSSEKSRKNNSIDSMKILEKRSGKNSSELKDKHETPISQEKIQITEEQNSNDTNHKYSNNQESKEIVSKKYEEKENSITKSSHEISQQFLKSKSIPSKSIEKFIEISQKIIGPHVFNALKENTASSYVIEHYIYAFNYLEALSDVFMAKNLSIALNKINQYAYIKNLYDALNMFTLPYKRDALGKIFTYSEILKMYEQGQIEMYQNYLNQITLFAKRDAFVKIKEFALKVELREYEEDEEKIIEIYKETLNKLSTIINRRYFLNLIDCLTDKINISYLEDKSVKNKLNKVNSRYNSDNSFSKTIKNVENSPNIFNESQCSKFSKDINNDIKTPSSSREKMKNFSKNKLDCSLNKSNSIKKSLSQSRIKNNTYLYESLSEKSCVVECNSFESPKLHRIYMLIEEQKKAQKYLRKKENCDQSDDVKYNQNQSNKSNEEISNYYLDLHNENLENSNKNISMIQELLTEEKESIDKNSQKNINADINITHSISLLDSSNGNFDPDKNFDEKSLKNQSKSIIKSLSVNLNDNISEVIENILEKNDEIDRSQQNISEVIDNFIENSIDKSINKSIEKFTKKSVKSLNNSGNQDISIDLVNDFSNSKSSKRIKTKSLNNSSIEQNLIKSSNRSSSLIKENSNSIIKCIVNEEVVNSKDYKSFDKVRYDNLQDISDNRIIKENLDKSEINYSNGSINSKNNFMNNSLKRRIKISKDNSFEIKSLDISRAYSDKNVNNKSIKDTPLKYETITTKDVKIIDKCKSSEDDIEEEIEIVVEEIQEENLNQEKILSKILKESESKSVSKSQENISEKHPIIGLNELEFEGNTELIKNNPPQNIIPQEEEIKTKEEDVFINENSPKIDEIAELISNEILEDLFSNEIEEQRLFPKKLFNLRKDNQLNSSRYSNSVYSGSYYSSFNNLAQSDINPASIFNKTILDHKKEETKNIYEQKILPQLIKVNANKVKENYSSIIENLKIPHSYNINELLLFLVKAPTINFRRNFLNLPKGIKDKNLIPKDKILTIINEITNSIRKESGYDKEHSEYDDILNQCVIDATEEIINKERLYGEQGEPLPWSIRTRNATFKYTQSEISKNNLVKFLEEEIYNLSNFKMGLIQENNEDLETEQLNLEKEKRMINNLTTYLQETDDVWRNFEVEETQVKLELTEMVLEQILNETIEILEHVHMSRIKPSLYQYKSIYTCDDIPRLSFHQVNTDYDNDVMNI